MPFLLIISLNLPMIKSYGPFVNTHTDKLYIVDILALVLQ